MLSSSIGKSAEPLEGIGTPRVLAFSLYRTSTRVLLRACPQLKQTPLQHREIEGVALVAAQSAPTPAFVAALLEGIVV